MNAVETVTVAPIAAASGTVRLPGSKSISNRALLLAALAEGDTLLTGLLKADDTDRMIECLAALGVKVEREGESALVHGCSGWFPVKEASLFAGNAGTAVRPLTAALAFAGGSYRLDGVPRMRERPIGDLLEALRSMGARIRCTGREGYLPLEFEPAVPSGSRVSVRGNVSSQFLTALLMAAPGIAPGGGLAIDIAGELISRPYVDMTVKMMKRFGASVEEFAGGFLVQPGRYLAPGRYAIEADASGASYFLALGALAGGPVRVTGVGENSIQGDTAFASIIERMGAKITWGTDFIEASLPAGAALSGIEWDCTRIPDAAMTLVPMALKASGAVKLTGIASWRVKETDRLAAMAAEMRKFGAVVEEGPDWISVRRAERVLPARVATYDDHRMAMSLALAAAAGVPVTVEDPKCTAKTFPGFFDAFSALAVPAAEVIAIDGPTASGKGTVASRVAAALGFHYLDSGALFRLTALACLEAGTDLADGAACAAAARSLSPEFTGGRIWLSGRDVTAAIREERVGVAASRVAVHPGVRDALLALERAACRAPGLVADGRDMGSVVFPQARLKVYLTASAQSRAERRYKQLIDNGLSANLPALVRDLEERDRRDRERSAAPLVAAAGARILDSTALTAEETVAKVLEWWKVASAGS